jgi:hypothetical protein
VFTPLLVAALSVSAPVPKQVSTELKWRISKGDTFYVTTEMDATSAVNGAPGGNVQGNTSAAVFVYKATVASADDKGSTLEVEFLSCKAGSGAGGAKLDDQPVAGKKLTFTLDKDHKVTKADGDLKLAAAGGILTNQYVQGHVQDLLRAVPGQVLGNGGTWKGEEELPLADGMVVKRTDRGTVAGTEDGLTKLEVESDNAMSGGPKNVGVKFDLKGEKGKRTVLFDPKAGRVRKLTEEYTVSGTIDLGGGLGGAGGGAAPAITVSMTMKAKVTVSDTEPKEGK